MRKVGFLSLLLALSVVLFAQTGIITGKVVDATGNPVPFASINIKGTNYGVSADANGDFKITMRGSETFVVTATGYESKEVTPTGGNVLVTLVATGTTIEEVVVTAGGTKTLRRGLGTASTVIKADNLVSGKATNVASGLQGKVAGMMINGTNGGVNPNFRMILRGQRSLTGNNQALIVLDNVIVPNDVLGNLNPNDVDEVTVLNGSGAAALYGSQASNGAIIVTTKKGRAGQSSVVLSHTTTIESVGFYPKIQKNFGAGGSSYGYDEFGLPAWSYIENQSYGPPFDGSKRELGAPLEDGRQDSAYYAYNNGHYGFWQRGITNQEDISLTSGDEKSTFYLAGQYAGVTGTTPGDKYNRTSLRINGTRKIGKSVMVTYATGYVQNRYDITTQTGSMYGNMLNMPSNVDITKYKNWRTDPFANPIGYYNPWYENPYFSADNYRNKTRNDYLTGNIELKFTPIQGLDFVARQGIASRNYSWKYTQAEFLYTEYSKHTDASSKTDIPGTVADGSGYTTELITDGFVNYNKKFLNNDFSLTAIAGVQMRQDETKSINVAGSGLVIPDVFNVGVRVGELAGGESNAKARQVGIYGDVRLSYKNFLYLHGTGRQDKVSVLDPANNTFFYPSVDAAVVLNQAIKPLSNVEQISLLKIRAGWSKVGQVNLPGNYGAYQLLPVYGQAYGYPYGSNPGFTAGNTLVSPSLKPEITKGYEAGLDLNLFRDRFTSSVTYYSTTTSDQTVSTRISPASGFYNYRTNVGKTSSKGWEITTHGTPVRTDDLEVTVGGNYTHLNNRVEEITADIPRVPLATYGNGAGSYAVAGQAFPVIMGFDYKRDPQGRVIVDRITGLPSKSDTISILGVAQYPNRLSLDGALRYKNLTFSILFEYRGGAQIYNNMGGELDWSGTGYRTGVYNRERFVFPNSVINTGTAANPVYEKNTNITIKDGNGNAGYWTDGVNRDVSSNYVTSADFWKLREASIAYDIPSRYLGDQKYLKGIRISVQGRNLLMWMAKDNYYTDPEFSDGGNDTNGIGLTGIGQTPPSRFYGATLTLKF